jgi:hypothetical protein
VTKTIEHTDKWDLKDRRDEGQESGRNEIKA